MNEFREDSVRSSEYTLVRKDSVNGQQLDLLQGELLGLKSKVLVSGEMNLLPSPQEKRVKSRINEY